MSLRNTSPTPSPLRASEPGTRTQGAARTKSSQLAVPAHAPCVMFLGGMDTPPVHRLLGTWFEAAALAALPDHRVAVATLVKRAEQPQRLPFPPEFEAAIPARAPAFQRDEHRPVPPTERAQRVFADLAVRALRHIDGVRYGPGGRAQSLLGALVLRFADLPVRYLYQPSYCAFVTARVRAVLADPAVRVVVGHSFGGSVAFDVITRAVADGSIPASRQLRLLTLGTNLGVTLTESPLYATLPRTADGRIACPPNLRWTHFYSPTDLFVGAPARPRVFASLEEVEVDTGSPLTWPPTRTHSARRYLCTPQVQRALQEALC